jgi:hypothetical protein
VPEGGGIYGAWERGKPGEAWLYTAQDPRYCVGSSLCYWRSTWERKPFPAVTHGEDTQWQTGLKRASVSSINGIHKQQPFEYDPPEPRLIATIHGGNTALHIDEKAQEWRRVPEWDTYCRTRICGD